MKKELLKKRGKRKDKTSFYDEKKPDIHKEDISFYAPDHLAKKLNFILKDKRFEKMAGGIEISFNQPYGEIAKIQSREINRKHYFLRKDVERIKNCKKKHKSSIKFYSLYELPIADFIKHNYNSVVVFPIGKKPPLLVFKRLGETVNLVKVYFNPENPEDLLSSIYRYCIFWDGKFRKDFPVSIKRKYLGYISQLYFGYCSAGSFPDGVVEIPLKLIIDEGKKYNLKSPFLAAVKKEFKKIGLIGQEIGRKKSLKKKKKKIRDFVISEHEKYKAKGQRRYHSKIWHSLDGCISWATIKRIIDKYEGRKKWGIMKPD